MTVVNYETGEIVEPLSEQDAERLSDRIALRLDAIADNYSAVVPMIREAVERRAWMALGYRSPGEYASTRFGGSLARLGAEFRQDVARELAEMGMSTRAIGEVVGASKDTVRRDLDATGASAPVGPVTGLNGKTYARPVPHPQSSEVEPPSEPSRPTEDVEPPLADSDDVEPDVQPEGGAFAAVPQTPVSDEGEHDAQPPRPPSLVPVSDDVWTDQDRAEELAGNLARNLSLLYAITSPERRQEYIATWRLGTRSRAALGQQFITPKHMRTLADALRAFATEWENAHV